MAHESVEITPDVPGSEAPNQPMYEEAQPTNEPEATQEGQAQEAPPEQQFEVPDKFMRADGSVDIESLSKSYMELERSKAAPTPETEANEESQESTPESPTHLVSQDEMSMFSQQIAESGDLTPETYASLEARGLPEDLVRSYIAGQTALNDSQTAEYLDTVGGEEAYGGMVEWAQNSLPQSELEAYNNILETGNHDAIKMAIQGMFARYQGQNNSPELISGGSGTASSTQGFTSWKQVSTAMRDTRYHNDPGYRKEIQDRLRVSNI